MTYFKYSAALNIIEANVHIKNVILHWLYILLHTKTTNFRSKDLLRDCNIVVNLLLEWINKTISRLRWFNEQAPEGDLEITAE